MVLKGTAISIDSRWSFISMMHSCTDYMYVCGAIRRRSLSTGCPGRPTPRSNLTTLTTVNEVPTRSDLGHLRTGHAYTGEFRRRFAFDEPHSCPCDDTTLETREHVLIHCPRFEIWRQNLRQASRNIVLSEILGTHKGIEALEVFLRRSKAFTRPPEPHPRPTPPDDRHPDTPPPFTDHG